MADTARLGLPYPTDADLADVPNWMFALASELDSIMPSDSQGPIGSRPAAGVQGRYYTSTNEGAAPVLYRDDGTAWRRVSTTPARIASPSNLPTNPADGDAALWVPPQGAALAPVTWLLRYHEAATRWEFAGGDPLTFRSNAAVGPIGAVLPTWISVQPSFLCPRAGWWDVEYGASGFVSGPTSGAGYGACGVAYGASTPTGPAMEWQMGSAATPFGCSSMQNHQLEIGHGVTVGMVAGTFASHSFQLTNRWIRIKPVYLYKVSAP